MRASSLAVLLTLSLSAAAQAQPRLAYEQGGAIVVAEPDGATPRVVGHGHDPVLSPDGSRVVFTGTEMPVEPAALLSVVAVDTGATVLRTKVRGGMNGAPAWSPDSRRLAIGVEERLIVLTPTARRHRVRRVAG